MLTEDQVNDLTKDINDNYDLPYIGERKEAIIIKWLVQKADAFLERNLPPEMYGYVMDAADGISDDEAKIMTDRIATWLNGEIGLPFVSEETEQVWFAGIVGAIIERYKKGKSA